MVALVLIILRIPKDTYLLGKEMWWEISISRRAIPQSLRLSSNREEILTILHVLQVYNSRTLFSYKLYPYQTIISLPDLSPSAKKYLAPDAQLLRQHTWHRILTPRKLGAFHGWLPYSLAPDASGRALPYTNTSGS